MPNINLPDYLNRYDPAKGYDELLFRSDKVIQAEEFNELQSGFNQRLRGISDALMADGAIVRDAKVFVNAQTGATRCENGAIYADGAVRGVPPASFIIATVGTVIIGVYLQECVVTELDDPTLRNRAKNTRGVDQPGAARLKKTLVWGYAGDNQPGKFYPVYTVIDGSLLSKEPPPNLDGVSQAIARYDRDSSGGSYVVDGLNVSKADDLPSGEQVYTVSEGRARVNGTAVELTSGRRLVFAATPDLRYIQNEPHQSSTLVKQRITTDRNPIKNLVQVTITAQKTTNVVHGSFSGAADPLEDGSVLNVLEVKQGATVFKKDIDFKFSASQIDWSPAGAEPATNSTYQVTYQYLANVTATDVDTDGFSVTGAVVGTPILVNYNCKLPRIDRLCLDANGQLSWIKGVAADRNPRAPSLPGNLLPLASVYQNWRSNRQISNDGVRTVPMNTLEAYASRLDFLTSLIAQQYLASTTQLIEAGAKKGIFVDAFINNQMRDQGLTQTAAIFGGELTLPVDAKAYALSNGISAPTSLAFNPVPVLEQTLRTGAMKINPYQAFDPLPAEVKLNPAIDRWTDIDTQWTSAKTENITFSNTVRERELTEDARLDSTIRTQTEVNHFSSQVTRTLNSSARPAEFLRKIPVSFSIAGFAANETLATLRFDGVSVMPVGLQKNNGVITGSFTIPDKITTGNKRVEFVGSAGSYGAAMYSGTGVIVTDIKQLVTIHTTATITREIELFARRADPLAQTFTLASQRQISGIGLYFTARGSSKLSVQIRETRTGFPTQNVIAQARVDASSVKLEGQETLINFDRPVLLDANTEYAIVVMCDDATSALAIAELGKRDDFKGQWVAEQPYTVGVLLSSSNASTWTPHQDRDLSFRLLAANYTEASHTVNLGYADINNVTDLMLLALAEINSAANRVEYSITLPDNSTITVDDGQPVRFATALSGRFSVSAKLSGTPELAPVIFPGTTLVAGSVANTADYVGRLIPAGANSRLRLVVEANLPAGSSLVASFAPEVAGNAPITYSVMPNTGSKESGDGYYELSFEVNGINDAKVRPKLQLSGTTAARPRVRNLRVLTV